MKANTIIVNERARWRMTTSIVIGVSSGAAFPLKFGWIEAEVITEALMSQVGRVGHRGWGTEVAFPLESVKISGLIFEGLAA